MQPDQVIQTMKDSVLRGRGGAGFPTGLKWGFIPKGGGKPHYLVVNADESEPGACKDMPTLLNNPQALIEGIVIACYAIDAHRAFIYVRGEVLHVIRRVHARGGRGLPGRFPRRRTSSAPGSTSRWWCTPGRAPTSAARRPRCSTRWRATAASPG